MRLPRTLPGPALIILATLALGCAEENSQVAGVETGPCAEGDCFDGLMCLSNLCVGEGAMAGGTADSGGGDGSGNTDATTPSEDATADADGPDDDGPNDDGPNDDGPNDDGPNDDGPNGNDSDSGDTTAGLETCDAIDILFVIDNSISMGSEQTRLFAALPGFIEDLDARLGPTDPHFMITDVDAWPFELCDQACNPPPECVDANGQCILGLPGECYNVCGAGLVCSLSYPCEGFPHEACDEVLGAGIDHTFGTGSSEQACEFASGARYIDATEPDLLDALACATQVGTDSFAAGLPMQALVEAVRGDGDAQACNEGFIRDGAMLMVVFITDEDDDGTHSEGNPALWHSAVLDAKGGDPNAVVMLGLFGDGDLPFSQCDAAPEDDSAESSQRLRSFMQLWGDSGVFGSVCAPSYGGPFAEAVDLLQTRCAAL